jgi:putative ABC transport system permease protein
MQNIRYGLRMLRKTPGVSLLAMAALALGIGANTAIFSVVDAILLRPLPYHNPGQLVTFNNSFRGNRAGVSVLELADYRKQAGVFQAVAALLTFDGNMTGGDQPERVQAVGAEASYFQILDVPPLLGRTFDASDQRDGWTEIAVISYGLWQRRFGGTPDVIGKKIHIDDDAYSIIGVMPSGFRHPDARLTTQADVFLPCGFRGEPFANPTKREFRFLDAIGRLRPATSLPQAERALATVSARLRQDYPQSYANEPAAWGVRVRPLEEQVIGEARPALIVLLCAVVLVLLIACTNVANLLLARSTARRREIAVRVALGASRAQLMRQLLTESVLLAVLGGVLGLLLAFWGVDLLVAFAPPGLPRVHEIRLDGRVLAFTLLVSLATGILFGIAPAIASSRADPQTALREEGGGSLGAAARFRLLNLLVVGEFALALVLLSGAGLLQRSLWKTQHVDPGFDAHGVLAARLWLPQPNKLDSGRYFKLEQRTGFFRQLLERLATSPGVESAAVVSRIPLRGDATRNQGGFIIEGREREGQEHVQVAQLRIVSPDYFRALRIPLRRGRGFGPEDHQDAPRVALVNETLARHFWPGQDVLGKRLRFPGPPPPAADGKPAPPPWITIVGVVADVKSAALDAPTPDELYLAYPQGVPLAMAVVVRGAGGATNLDALLRAKLRELDPELPLFEVATLDNVLQEALSARRFTAILLGLFAAVALIMAALGIYGVMAYVVGQRRREIALRMAIGANESDVLRLVVRRGLRLVGVGLLIGGCGMIAVSHLISSLLYGISPADPLTFVSTALLLGGVALCATWLPARRAAQTSPMLALRE